MTHQDTDILDIDAAADDATTDDASADTGADAAVDDTAGEADLGDAGKQALDRMKAREKATRERARVAEAELAALKAKSTDGDKPDVDQIREQAKAEARAEVLKDRVGDKIEAAAAKLFADPADAAVHLRDQLDDFIDDGKVDADAISDALAELLEKKPYLAAAAQGDGKRFKGAADGGTRKETRPSQLGKADMARMSPEQIEDARVAGRFDDLLSGKSS